MWLGIKNVIMANHMISLITSSTTGFTHTPHCPRKFQLRMSVVSRSLVDKEAQTHEDAGWFNYIQCIIL